MIKNRSIFPDAFFTQATQVKAELRADSPGVFDAFIEIEGRHMCCSATVLSGGEHDPCQVIADTLTAFRESKGGAA